MSGAPNPSNPDRARLLIEQAAALAKHKLANQMLERMEEDDVRDLEEGLLGSSGSGSGSGLSSEDFPTSQASRSKSPGEASQQEPADDHVLGDATLHEGDANIDATQCLSSEYASGNSPAEGYGSSAVVSTRSEEHAGSPGQTTSWEPTGGRRRLTTPVFRPTVRPPTAVLHVFDDNQETFDRVRIRQTPFDIGRNEGNLTLPHERLMSRRHARIDRRLIEGQWQWTLRDLGGINGTFVSARKVRLRNGDELLLGADLVRFYQQGGPENAMLAKVIPGRLEEQVTLRPGVHWIGSDANQCLPILKGNALLDPRHLRIELDEDRQWRLYDCGSTNRIWVRVEEIRLVDGCCFQAGEQRFSFHLP